MTKVKVLDEQTGEVELVEDNALDIVSQNIEVLPYGLKFRNQLSREEWSKAFLSLQQAHSIYQWYLGDLVSQAEYQWKGEMYDKMMESTGYELQTLRNLSSIASIFNPDVREHIYDTVKNTASGIFKLSWSHFQDVAPLMNSHEAKAIDFLIRAGKEGWSKARLREQIALWKNEGKLPQPEEKELPDFADGWTSVKDAGVKAIVTAPETVYDDHLDDNYYFEADNYKRVAVQLFKHEVTELIEVLEGDDRFTSLIDRLQYALGGI